MGSQCIAPPFIGFFKPLKYTGAAIPVHLGGQAGGDRTTKATGEIGDMIEETLSETEEGGLKGQHRPKSSNEKAQVDQPGREKPYHWR
ncbi:hypothetical protein GMST_01950 [Geomonas silvestris]|uniref:Uncharacterized protein n=1 Tax=Geomonas silvestris TaxID=2740184 RepID=A0A6V8MCZ2_9BACT|nr:hypothetical protein GMST_01950 [Geomonas silvestris]